MLSRLCKNRTFFSQWRLVIADCRLAIDDWRLAIAIGECRLASADWGLLMVSRFGIADPRIPFRAVIRRYYESNKNEPSRMPPIAIQSSMANPIVSRESTFQSSIDIPIVNLQSSFVNLQSPICSLQSNYAAPIFSAAPVARGAPSLKTFECDPLIALRVSTTRSADAIAS
jgi:hypothetical protein